MTTTRTLTVVGLPEQVANVIRNHRAAGTLIAMTVPRPVSATDPRVRVGIRLAQPLPSMQVDSIDQYIADRHRTRNHTRRQVALVVALTAAAVAVIAVGAWLVAQVVAFVAAHAAVIVGAIVLAAITAGLLLTATTSGKRHCPGC